MGSIVFGLNPPANRLFLTLDFLLPILGRGDYTYHITGGFAAHLFGATREVNDIDIALPQRDFLALSQELKSFVVEGPARVLAPPWDLWLTVLRIGEQMIDLSGDEEPRVLHKSTGEWVRIPENFETDVVVAWGGFNLRVQHPNDLAAYKSVISWNGDELKHMADAAAARRWLTHGGGKVPT
jgi:hypothetical protein